MAWGCATAMKIRYNIEAFEQIRRHPAIAGNIDARAERIAAAAGEGYEASPYEGKTRHRASVIATDYDAIRAEAKGNGKLLGAIDAGR